MNIRKNLLSYMAIMSLAGIAAVGNMALAKPHSKTPAAANQAMEAPKPAKEIKAFTDHAGTYTGDATLTLGEKVATFKLTHVNKVISDGFGLQCTESGVSKEMGMYHSVDLFGFDPGKETVHFFTVSNMSETRDYSGKWTDDKTLDMEYDGMKDGKPYVDKINVVFDSPTQYHFSSEATLDGQPESTFKASMTKAK